MTVFGTTQAAAATAVSRASHIHTHTYPSNGARALYVYICFCTAQYSKQRRRQQNTTCIETQAPTSRNITEKQLSYYFSQYGERERVKK